MKIFLIICLVSGLASSEKLDRSYLPPPGSKFSGGTLGDIDVPLEFPKQHTGRPQLQNGKPEIELGINRRPAPTGAPGSQKPGFTYFQKSYPVPKTTTSYAITQTTTFPSDFEVDQPNAFVNSSNIPGVQAQNYPQPIRGQAPGQNYQQPISGQGPSYNQYQPGLSQSTLTPYGTTARPPFATFTGPQYLPPVSNKQSPSTVISNQDGPSYGSDLPQGPKYQNGETVTVKRPGHTPGINQQNQLGYQNIPSTVAPQYQNEQFGPTGFGFQDSPKQLSGSQFSQSTTAPQYQAGQRFLNPGANQQNLFLGNRDFPSSTTASQYQGSQRLPSPGSNQQQQFSGNQDSASSTTAPQFQTGQGFKTPGLNQQVFGSRIPNQQNQYTGSQYQGNQIPSSTLAPQYQAGQRFTTPGSAPTSGPIQNEYSGNHNYPSTAAPNYQDGQRFTTPGQIQGIIPGQHPFGSRLPGQNKYPSQNLPSSTTAPQFQDSKGFTTPGYIQGYGSSVPTQHNGNQYPGSQSFPSSTTAPQYQSGQQFTTGPDGQNFPTTAAPFYQNGQRFSTPGQYERQRVPEQQFGSPNVQGSSPSVGNQNYPSSTIAPQYQDNQRFSTPESQQNQYENQNFPTSTAAPQYPDQNFSTPGQIINQHAFPGSTSAPPYQQTFASSTDANQPAPSQQNQFQRPVYNQQIPSSTTAPQGFVPGSQPQFGNNLPIPVKETFSLQGSPGSQSYENNQQPASQPEAGSSIYGPAPSFSNQRFPSTTGESLPARDYTSTSGFESNSGSRPDRPQAEGDRNAEILNYENVITPEGYFYSYDTSNGIHADETGVVGNGTRAQGGYTYTGDDGKVYSVVYTADENGFQPHGDHLPTPPPIPEAIQRVIDQAKMDKEAGIDDDGSYNEEKYGFMKYEGPLIRLKSKNKTVALVNGAGIPERSEDSNDGHNRRLLNPKGRRPGSKSGSKQEIGSQETDINDTDLEETDINEGIRDDDNLKDNKEVNRRPSANRPKPVKNLSVKDNMPDRKKGIKTKPLINSKKESNHLQISTEEYEDNVPNDSSEELEDNEDMQDSDDYDVDSDQVNYKDDPNNRTDFHGLNKYLPESKKTNRKNQSGKKRPALRVNSVNKLRPSVKGDETNEDRYSEQPQSTKLDFDDKFRTSIPARKNTFGKKVTGQTVPLDSDDETNAYDDGETYTNKNYKSDNTSKPLTNNRKYKPDVSNNRFSSKSKRPTTNQQGGDSNNKDNNRTPASYEETGYEYNPPQRKFSSGINQKGSQTTVRPFLTKNVYSDGNEPIDEYIDEYRNGKPGHPIANYPGYNDGGDQNTENNGFSTTRRPGSIGTSRPFGMPQTTGTPSGITIQKDEVYQSNPEVNQNRGYSTTRRPTYGTSQRPFGRPQATLSPQYEEQGVTGQEGDIYQTNPEVNQNDGFSTTMKPSFGTSQQPFGRPQTSGPLYQDPVTGQVYVSNQGPQKPEDKLYYNTNTPNRGTVSNVFSITPLPPSGPDSSIYQRPGQSQNIPTDGSHYETSPSEQTYVRPGQVPSTTYRPNYSFGDKISSVTVDANGRPIQSTSAPTFDHTLRPTYSVRPGDTNYQVGDRFKPNQGRFGVTSGPDTTGYPSTSAPIGEDFSGPKQPQRFDPVTGYHYK